MPEAEAVFPPRAGGRPLTADLLRGGRAVPEAFRVMAATHSRPAFYRILPAQGSYSPVRRFQATTSASALVRAAASIMTARKAEAARMHALG